MLKPLLLSSEAPMAPAVRAARSPFAVLAVGLAWISWRAAELGWAPAGPWPPPPPPPPPPPAAAPAAEGWCPAGAPAWLEAVCPPAPECPACPACACTQVELPGHVGGAADLARRLAAADPPDRVHAELLAKARPYRCGKAWRSSRFSEEEAWYNDPVPEQYVSMECAGDEVDQDKGTRVLEIVVLVSRQSMRSLLRVSQATVLMRLLNAHNPRTIVTDSLLSRLPLSHS
ncbi:unnamed protein product [Prorocentrum cordatum]|uniref:Uncharacterized protein n=1 Tax=Prorocentrum cordatum TaxID=2364126 RepID=A0ABN9SZC2_9DINO|nr:unnamed protein product [Polarella glacialis]